jgi:hypothetical protein
MPKAECAQGFGAIFFLFGPLYRNSTLSDCDIGELRTNFAAESPAKLRMESSQPNWARTALRQWFGEHNRQRDR